MSLCLCASVVENYSQHLSHLKGLGVLFKTIDLRCSDAIPSNEPLSHSVSSLLFFRLDRVCPRPDGLQHRHRTHHRTSRKCLGRAWCHLVFKTSEPRQLLSLLADRMDTLSRVLRFDRMEVRLQRRALEEPCEPSRTERRRLLHLSC